MNRPITFTVHPFPIITKSAFGFLSFDCLVKSWLLHNHFLYLGIILWMVSWVIVSQPKSWVMSIKKKVGSVKTSGFEGSICRMCTQSGIPIKSKIATTEVKLKRIRCKQYPVLIQCNTYRVHYQCSWAPLWWGADHLDHCRSTLTITSITENYNKCCFSSL